jgi:hypothetical protein
MLIQHALNLPVHTFITLLITLFNQGDPVLPLNGLGILLPIKVAMYPGAPYMIIDLTVLCWTILLVTATQCVNQLTFYITFYNQQLNLQSEIYIQNK